MPRGELAGRLSGGQVQQPNGRAVPCLEIGGGHMGSWGSIDIDLSGARVGARVRMDSVIDACGVLVDAPRDLECRGRSVFLLVSAGQSHM